MSTEKIKTKLDEWKVAYALNHKFEGVQKKFSDAAGVSGNSIRSALRGIPVTTRIAEKITTAGGLDDIPAQDRPHKTKETPEMKLPRPETPEQVQLTDFCENNYKDRLLKVLERIAIALENN